MLIWEIFVVALSAIRANVLRSILTALGIVIGVAAVIAMVSLGEGAQQQVQAQIDKRGANVITIRGGQRMRGGVDRGEKPLTSDDAEALIAEAGSYLEIAPVASQQLQISYSRWNTNNSVIGTWPGYLPVNNYNIFVGEFFNEGHLQGRRRVVVLGWNMPEKLRTSAVLLLGKTIQIKGIPFEVIGIMEEKGDMGWRFRPDDYVYIPLTTGQHRLFGGDKRENLDQFSVQTRTSLDMDRAYGDIDRILRRQHRIVAGGDPDFNVSGATDWLEARADTNATFKYLLMGIAAISLLVGGIGIMNIMMVSVTERTREIGLRKAMGATRANILSQFLIEALVLCFLGGMLGLLSGVGGSVALAHFAEWETAVKMNAVIVAIVFSVVVGLFFGIWPAQRAARLDPIDALRYE